MIDHSTIGGAPPGIIGTVVKKSNKDLGISFQDHPTENVVYIHKVKGKFRKHTMLAAGLRVTHVNGFIVFKASEAMKLIQKTPIGGSVQVIASGNLIEMRKPSRFILRSASSSSAPSSPSVPLGIHLRPLPGRLGLIQITKVDSLLTEIPIGHLLVSINKRPVTSVKKAHWYLRMCRQRVKLITCPVKSFSCISLKSKGVVEPLELTDHDSVNAFHPNLIGNGEDEDDLFSEPLSSAWKNSPLEQQLTELKMEQEQPPEDNDTVLNQYESDLILLQYRIRRRQDSSSTTQSYLFPSSPNESQEKNTNLQSIAKDEHGDFTFENDEPPIMVTRLPSSLHQSARSLASSHQAASMASSEAASGLPDMIMNLQTQNDLMDEALGSLMSGQPGENNQNITLHDRNNSDDMVPFIFVDSGSESGDSKNQAEDLKTFLAKEGHLQQNQDPLPTENILAKALESSPNGGTTTNSHPLWLPNGNEQSPLRDKTNKSSPYSPSFFDRKKRTSSLFQSVEKAKRSGENKSPLRRRQDIPALLDAASVSNKKHAEQVGAHQNSKVCLPVHINITSMDAEDLQSFLTEEEEKVDYVLELIQPQPSVEEEKKEEGEDSPKQKEKFSFSLPKSLPSSFQQGNAQYQQVHCCMPLEAVIEDLEEEESKYDEDEEDEEDEIVEEMDDESLLIRGLHFLQAIAADATTCMSPSRRYHPNRQFEVHAV